MSTYDLAQRRRKHVFITISHDDPATVPEWQTRAVSAWIRETKRDLDLPTSCTDADWGALLRLAPPSAASCFGLMVLAQATDVSRAVSILRQHGPAMVLWLTASPAAQLLRIPELAHAAASGRVQTIDLTDDYSDINENTQVLLGDAPFTSWHRLGDLLREQVRMPGLSLRGSKRDQEIARRLGPVLDDEEGAFEAIVVMGPHHPAVRRVRALREQQLITEHLTQPSQAAWPKTSPTQRCTSSAKQARQISKRYAISLTSAERLLTSLTRPD